MNNDISKGKLSTMEAPIFHFNEYWEEELEEINWPLLGE